MKMQRRTLYAVAKVSPYPECVVRDILHLYTLKEATAAWEKLRSEFEQGGKKVEKVENVTENVQNAGKPESAEQDRRPEEPAAVKNEPLKMTRELADQLRPMSRDDAISYLMEHYGKDKKSASIFLSNLIKKYGKQEEPAPRAAAEQEVILRSPRRLKVRTLELVGAMAWYRICEDNLNINVEGKSVDIPMGDVADLAAELMEIAGMFGGGGNG